MQFSSVVLREGWMCAILNPHRPGVNTAALRNGYGPGAVRKLVRTQSLC